MRPRATPSSVYEFYLHDRPGGTWEWSIQFEIAYLNENQSIVNAPKNYHVKTL